MKKLLASLLAMGGLIQPTSAGEMAQTLDPKSILFTVPTISNDLALLDPIGNPPQPDDPQMHEDDWCQVEFFRKDYVVELQRILKEYKVFEISNRQMTVVEDKQYPAWRNTYVRKVLRVPLLRANEPVPKLANIVGGQIGPAPALYSSSSWLGRVKNGFTIRIGRNVDLYGYVADGGIPILAASLGSDPDNQSLVAAFGKLNTSLGLVLVDWKSQFILLGPGSDGKVQAWQPQ